MKVAVIQMVSGAGLPDNLRQAAELLSQAASQGAALVLLPEYFCQMGQRDADKLSICESLGSGPVSYTHLDVYKRQVQGRFLQPLLARRNGQWRDWEGQLFAAFEHVDLRELRRYADPGFDLSEGKGALRAWVDVNRGQITGATADVALSLSLIHI